MTLAQKLRRSARDRDYYRRNAVRIREQKRIYMAERSHRLALTRAIEAARHLFTVSPLATKTRSEACV